MNFIRLFGLAAVSVVLLSCGEPQPGADKLANAQHTASILSPEVETRPSGKEADGKTYRSNNFENLPEGFSGLFKPGKDADQSYTVYLQDIDRAYFELKGGNLSKAAESFAAISKETLFETPNDAAWIGHAESLCRLGKKTEGRKQLNEAQCSQQLMSKKRSCTDLDNQKSEPDFPSGCYREYCAAEILRPDYDEPFTKSVSQEDQIRINAYDRHLDTIASLCR
jgi:hypothetical protein